MSLLKRKKRFAKIVETVQAAIAPAYAGRRTAAALNAFLMSRLLESVA